MMNIFHIALWWKTGQKQTNRIKVLFHSIQQGKSEENAWKLYGCQDPQISTDQWKCESKTKNSQKQTKIQDPRTKPPTSISISTTAAHFALARESRHTSEGLRATLLRPFSQFGKPIVWFNGLAKKKHTDSYNMTCFPSWAIRLRPFPCKRWDLMSGWHLCPWKDERGTQRKPATVVRKIKWVWLLYSTGKVCILKSFCTIDL